MIDRNKTQRMPSKISHRLRYYIWQVCPKCKQGRWIYSSHVYRQGFTGLCNGCLRKDKRAEKSNSWRGGRFKIRSGYINVYVKEDDFFYPMAQINGYVKEHRLVMAKHLGRCLHLWEIVHHKNHIKDDNGLENLQLTSRDGHTITTILERRVEYLEGLLLNAGISFKKNYNWKIKMEV